MSSDLNHRFDAGKGRVEGGMTNTLGREPMSSPADKVSGKGSEMLLQEQTCLRAHFEMMHGEDALAFFNARFNGLASIVVLKPAAQIGSDGMLPIMK